MAILTVAFEDWFENGALWEKKKKKEKKSFSLEQDLFVLWRILLLFLLPYL